MKALHSFETSIYVKLHTRYRNVPEGCNPQESLKNFVTKHITMQWSSTRVPLCIIRDCARKLIISKYKLCRTATNSKYTSKYSGNFYEAIGNTGLIYVRYQLPLCSDFVFSGRYSRGSENLFLSSATEMRLRNIGMTCCSAQAVYYEVKDTLTSVPSPTYLVPQRTYQASDTCILP